MIGAASAGVPRTAGMLLRERALRLAQPPKRIASQDVSRAVLRFELAGSAHAVDLRHVVALLPADDVTPIPGSAAVVRGVGYVHGRVLAVVDARLLLGLPQREPDVECRIVRVAVAGLDLGLLVDGQAVIDGISRDPLMAPPAGPDGGSLVEGITTDGIVVIDLERLAMDARLHVGERSTARAMPAAGSGGEVIGDLGNG